MEFNVGTVDLKFVVGLPALLYLFYCVYWEWTVGIQRRRLIKQNGCKPIRNHEEFNGFPKNVIGIKIIKENVKALREHRALEVLGSRHTRTANTIHHKTFFEDMIYTLEPENIKAMLATSFKDFGLSRRRQKAFIPLLGQGIFTSNGAAWQHSRDLLRPNFVRGQVGDLDTFESHVDQLISAIPADGSTFDLQSLFFQLTIDTATEFLFGESTNTLGSSASNEEKVRFAQAFNRSQEEIAYSIRSAKLHPWFRTKQFWEDCRYVHEFADRYVSRGLQYRQSMLEKNMGKEKSTTGGDEDGGRYVFLHELVKSIADPIRIRSELLNVLLAGRDTTASLLSGLFFVISRRPDVWNKLKAEVDQLRGQTPTFQQLKDMKYLRMTMNETLRLYPVVPYNARMSYTDTILPLGGGPDGKSPVFVPKNTTIQYNLYAMHRRKDYYGEDADEFRPERWDTLKPGWEYLPFHGGPRICIGQQFALTEASYTTVRLMQAFPKGFEARDERPWMELLTLTCCINQGTLVGTRT